MKKIFIYLILIILAISNGNAGDYFVKLSNLGKQYRSDLLQQKFENIPVLSSMLLKKVSNLQIEDIVKQSRHNDFLNNWMVISSDAQFVEKLKSSAIIENYEKVGYFKILRFKIAGKDYEQYYLKNILN